MKHAQRLTKFGFLALLLLGNIVWWNYIDRPHTVNPGPEKLDCVSYNPYRDEYSLDDNKKWVEPAVIDADLAIIAKKFSCVRTYTTLNGMDALPKIAEKYGLSVVIGTWVSENLLENIRDIDIAIKLANESPAVTHLLIGNEALFFDVVSPKYMYLYLSYVNARTEKPVSTGEIVSTWAEHKKLAEFSDFIAIHIFPYWNNVPIDSAIGYLDGEYSSMKNIFPNKEVMVAETGWPSNGVDRGKSVASLLNQALYVREVSQHLKNEGIRYNIIEAFDQPWKIFGTEKHAGGSFGVFDDRGREKFSLSGPLSLYGGSFMGRFIGELSEKIVEKFPIKIETALLPYFSSENVQFILKVAGIDNDIGLSTSIIFLIISIFLGWLGGHLRWKGFIPGAIVLLILTNIMVMIAYKAWIGHYIYLTQFWINIPLMLLPIAGILYQLRDFLKIVGRGKIKNHMTYETLKAYNDRKQAAGENNRPERFVSIHIPSYNEEPEMLIRTIEHATKLNYTNYEVIILENNTQDESIWKPVETFVKNLNKPNIKFYHFDNIVGYKSGALNRALELTDPRAEMIGLLDADYCVDPDWLTMTVGLFDEKDIAAVQCPQANETEGATDFQKIMCYELDLFYKQGMVIRNESNAIIMNGTMCLIRRNILEEEKWCSGFICEDSELGLRLQNRGDRIVYIDHTFGKGLPPRNFEEYKKQRFRWAYGAMMIFKTHWRKIFFRSGLNGMQRFEYLFGWIGWGQMILYPFYLLILLFGSYFIFESYSFEAPYDFALLTLFYVAFLMLSTIAIYRDRMHITFREAGLAILASASLTVTIFKAVFLAVFWNHLGFKKTNKGGKNIATGRLSWVKKHPGFITLVLVNVLMIVFSAGILFRYGVNTDTFIWFLLVVTVTLPTMGALFFQVIYE